DLHSFPTRRSSDLNNNAVDNAVTIPAFLNILVYLSFVLFCKIIIAHVFCNNYGRLCHPILIDFILIIDLKKTFYIQSFRFPFTWRHWKKINSLEKVTMKSVLTPPENTPLCYNIPLFVTHLSLDFSTRSESIMFLTVFNFLY